MCALNSNCPKNNKISVVYGLIVYLQRAFYDFETISDKHKFPIYYNKKYVDNNIWGVNNYTHHL